MNDIMIKCDECEKVFDVELVEIIQKSVTIKDKTIVATFFECPQCNKIYICYLQDSKYNKLALEIRDYRTKIENAMKYKNFELAKTYTKSMQVKKKRLDKLQTVLKVKYLDDVLKELNKYKGE